MKNNTIIIRGNVVKEPKLFADKKFAIIRLASNYQNRQDESKSMYFDVKIFGERLGDIDYFQPEVGDRLVVTGQLALDEYEKDGVAKSSMVIYCDHFEKIWRKPKDVKTEKPPVKESSSRF